MNVINLNMYRNKKRKEWFDKHRTRLEKVVTNFLDVSFGIPFEELQHLHMQSQRDEQLLSWDYVDFRNLLLESMERIISEHLWEELSYYPWFNQELFTKDELVYFAFNTYVNRSSIDLQSNER